MSADAMILPSHQENYGMVIAEALSVGCPVFLTDKVNLWREVSEWNAGIVDTDTQEGIERLIAKWQKNLHIPLRANTRKCFDNRLEVSHAALRLGKLLDELKTKD